MILTLIAAALAVALFLAMLVLIEAGRRIGAARLARDPDGRPLGAGAAEAAVFGLLGLLLAFTFSSAASRFQDRKDLVRQEANAIGTAYLRIDLTPGDAQAELRQLFRRYLDVRLATYSNVADENATQARLAEGAALQGDIWTKAVKACASPGAARDAALLLLPALNEMFDITTTRIMATRNHPPVAIFLLLFGMCLVGALLGGVRHFRQQAADLGSPLGLRGGAVALRVRDHRPRVPPPGPDPRPRRRPDPGRAAPVDALRRLARKSRPWRSPSAIRAPMFSALRSSLLSMPRVACS